jgi:DNA-binding Lrp family transcriptional regulator
LKAEDIRNLNWREIQARLGGVREMLWRDLMDRGPGTTLELAERSGVSAWTVRPRVTELVAMGFAVAAGARRRGRVREGIYAGVCAEDAEKNWARNRKPEQALMKLGC